MKQAEDRTSNNIREDGARALVSNHQVLTAGRSVNGPGQVSGKTLVEEGIPQPTLTAASQTRDEAEYGAWLIRRLIFREGAGTVSKRVPIAVGQSVVKSLGYDREQKLKLTQADRSRISLAHEITDQVTGALLLESIKLQESHVDWAAIRQAQLGLLGIVGQLTSTGDGASG